MGEETEFLGARMMTLANLMRRITTLRFRRDYDLSLVDGWIISRLGSGGPMSLDALAHRSGLAKSQMSRGVTNMVARHLVDRRRNPQNPSEVVLTLTEPGRATYRDIRRRAPRHNQMLTQGLDTAAVAALTDFVIRLTDNSRRNLDHEQSSGRATRLHRRS